MDKCILLETCIYLKKIIYYNEKTSLFKVQVKFFHKMTGQFG